MRVIACVEDADVVVRPAGEARSFAWMVVGVLGLMATAVVSFAVFAIAIGEPWAVPLVLPVAAFFVVGVLSVWLRFLSRAVPHRVGEEQVPRGAVTVLWLHRARSWVSLPLLSLVAGGLLLYALVAFADGQAGVGWFVLALGLLFVSFLPDHVRALVRRPRLELSPSGIRYRGQSVDAELEWDDVMSVGGSENARGGSLRLVAWSDSGRAKAGRIIWRFEDKPLGSEIAVTSNEPRDAELLGQVRVWIEEYWRQPHRRGELGTPVARERLELLRRMVEVPS